MEIKKININMENLGKISKEIYILLKNNDYSPIWQTIEWNLMLQDSKYIEKGIFLGIYDNKNLQAYIILEKRSISFGFFGLFGIGGPIYKDKKYLEIIGKEIIKISKEEKVIFSQIEPSQEEIQITNFKTNFYKNFIEKNTLLIDLNQSEEEILINMKPKGRYNIHLAEKNNVEIFKVDNNEKNLNLFYSLFEETYIRDNFSVNSKQYFRSFLNYIYNTNIGGLYFALKDNEIIASAIFLFFQKTAYYYYGASTSDNTKRKFMASYLIQWKAILEAKNKGCEKYDFLGIAGSNNKSSHLIGVTEFKLKFSSNIYKFPDTLIYVNKGLIFGLLKIKLLIKKFIIR